MVYPDPHKKPLHHTWQAHAAYDRGAPLLKATYSEMLCHGKVRADDMSLPSGYSDPKWALVFLIDYLRDMERDKVSDFLHLGFNTLRKPKRHELPYFLCWQNGILPDDQHSKFSLGDMTRAFRKHMDLNRGALPGPLAVYTLAMAVNTAKALRPYLEGTKTPAMPLHKQPLFTAFAEIVDLIELIGGAAGLSAKRITALKNEILEDGPLPVRDLPILLRRELSKRDPGAPPCHKCDAKPRPGKPDDPEIYRIKAGMPPPWQF